MSRAQFPVLQMLSERHDTTAIQFWLIEWLRLGAPLPAEVCCDFSLALLGAVVRAFTNNSNLAEYVNRCYLTLSNADYRPTNLYTYRRSALCQNVFKQQRAAFKASKS